MFFLHSGQARLDIFECGATTPSSSKTISWNDGTDAGVIYGPDGSVIHGGDGAVIDVEDGSVTGGQD